MYVVIISLGKVNVVNGFMAMLTVSRCHFQFVINQTHDHIPVSGPSLLISASS